MEAKSKEFVESLHDFKIAHRDHEPSERRSADSLVRESVGLGSRGQSCPRSKGRFMEKGTEVYSQA